MARSGRNPDRRVKTAKKRSESSTRWLQRQLNDPYVKQAKAEGYRSRAAYKLIELDEKHGLLKGVKRAVDLGCAPGGWLQILAERLPKGAEIIGIDLLDVEPVDGTIIHKGDFLNQQAEQALAAALTGPADLILSDMAAATTGHKQTDHLRTMALCEASLDFAEAHLRPGGMFVAKVLRGGADTELLARMKALFGEVKHAKPPASRSESVEWYVVAKGFRPSA